MHNSEPTENGDPTQPAGTAVAQLAKLLWARSLLIAAVAVLAMTSAIVAAAISKPDYTVEMIIMPRTDGGATGLMSQLGSMAGVASSLMGGGLRGGADSNFEAFRKLLQSERLYDEMERQHHLLRLFYPTQWDQRHQTWRPRTGPLRFFINVAKSALHVPVYATPRPGDLRNLMNSRMMMSQIDLTNLYAVSVRYRDPQVATVFLNKAVETADSLLRADAITRVQGQIDYVDQRLQTVTIEEHRRALGDLLVNLERQRMMMAGGGNFATAMLQTPTEVAHPTLGAIIMRILIWTLGGAALAAALVLLVPGRTGAINEKLARFVRRWTTALPRIRPRKTVANVVSRNA